MKGVSLSKSENTMIDIKKVLINKCFSYLLFLELLNTMWRVAKTVDFHLIGISTSLTYLFIKIIIFCI